MVIRYLINFIFLIDKRHSKNAQSGESVGKEARSIMVTGVWVSCSHLNKLPEMVSNNRKARSPNFRCLQAHDFSAGCRAQSAPLLGFLLASGMGQKYLVRLSLQRHYSYLCLHLYVACSLFLSSCGVLCVYVFLCSNFLLLTRTSIL